jgi:hypothetical protein
VGNQSERYFEGYEQEEENQCHGSHDVMAAQQVAGCHDYESQDGEFDCHFKVHSIRLEGEGKMNQRVLKRKGP